MRTLHVVASLSLRYGGVSVSVRELCAGLAQGGVEVDLATTLRGYDPGVDRLADERLRAVGVRLHTFPVYPWSSLGERYAYSPALEIFLRKTIPQVDLVHTHGLWQYPTAIVARICRKAKIPYLLSPCGALDPYGLRRHRLFKWLYGLCIERKTLQGAAALHFTSTMEQKRAFRFGARCPTFVIPRPIHLEEIPEVSPGTFRSRCPQVDQRRILLFLGRLHPKKRLDIVAEAFAFVAKGRPDVHLVISGPDDGAEVSVRKRLEQAGLSDRVTFTGIVQGTDKWTLLKDSSLFLLPSEDENFGVAVLEAMAMGVPVLLSPYVGLVDEVTRANAGAMIPLNPVAWSQTIERLLEDPFTLRAMGEAGRHLAATEFSSDRIASAMRDAYVTILRH